MSALVLQHMMGSPMAKYHQEPVLFSNEFQDAPHTDYN